jgi:uncharacterized protein YkwD
VQGPSDPRRPADGHPYRCPTGPFRASRDHPGRGPNSEPERRSEALSSARPAAGRHRDRAPSRGPDRGAALRGQIALGALVAGLLLVLGLGAALLPPAFGGGQATRAAGQAVTVAPAQPAAPPTATGAPGPAPSGVGALGAAPAPPSPTAKPSPAPARSTGAPSRGRQRTTVELREDEVVTLTNRERARAGCADLRVDSRLHAAARAHSEDMAATGTMSHTGSDGSTPWDRAEDAGYTQAMAENVAVGYRTPADVVEGWMNSDGHRANILNCDAKAIGVGLAYGRDGTPYWTQLFGRV